MILRTSFIFSYGMLRWTISKRILCTHNSQHFFLLLLARKFGATEFVNPKEIKGTTEDELVRITDGGCDYTFECIGNVNTMVSRRASFQRMNGEFKISLSVLFFNSVRLKVKSVTSIVGFNCINY